MNTTIEKAKNEILLQMDNAAESGRYHVHIEVRALSTKVLDSLVAEFIRNGYAVEISANYTSMKVIWKGIE